MLALVLAAALAPQQPGPGYTDTPFLPDSKWRVHDANRPRPRVVTPPPAVEKASKAPSDAIVLFDGSSLEGWTGRKDKASWKILDDGSMQVNGTGDIRTRQEFGDVQVHLEFMTPPPKGNSQGRGNSGLFFFGRYELQILDSYENPSYADGQCAALYAWKPPLVNACRKPGEWQTYDVVFHAPRWEGDTLKEPARITVLHNGILVHANQAYLGATAHKNVAKYKKHGPKGPIKLQDHGNPIRFRNIWVRPLDQEGETDSSEKKGG